MSRRLWGGVVWLLLLLAVGPSWPWLDNPFLRDDEALVGNNPAVRTVLPVHRYFTDPGTFSRIAFFNRVCYRPLTPLTFAWDAAATSPHEPRGFRRSNLLLHACVTLLLLGFLRALLRELAPDTEADTRDRVAVVTALLFAAHPYSAFTAQYVSNRSLLFMTLGSFAALWSYVAAWSSPRPAWAHLRTAACFAVALAGKENAVTLPAAFLLLELARDPDRAGGRSGWARVGGAGALAVAYLGLRAGLGLGAEQTNAPLAGGEALGYVLGQLRAQLTQYLPAVVWPAPIRWEPTGPPGSLSDPLAWGSLAITLAIIAFAVRRRRSDPVLALGLLAYPLAQLPTMLLAQPLPVLFYRPYPGLPFLFLALTWGLRDRLRLPVVGVVLVLAAGASYRVGFHQRTHSHTWLHSVEYGAQARAHFFLAGQVEDPEARREAYDRVIQRFPEFARTYLARAKERLLAGDTAGALADLEQAVGREARMPDYFLFTALAARAGGKAGLEQQARAKLRELGWPPSWAAAVRFAERALTGQRPALARDAIALMGPRPDAPWIVPYVGAVAHHQLGEYAAAVAAYRRALPGARGAGDARVAKNLALALVALGQCPQALPLFDEVLAATPGDPVAARARARCAQGAGAGARR